MLQKYIKDLCEYGSEGEALEGQEITTVQPHTLIFFADPDHSLNTSFLEHQYYYKFMFAYSGRLVSVATALFRIPHSSSTFCSHCKCCDIACQTGWWKVIMSLKKLRRRLSQTFRFSVDGSLSELAEELTLDENDVQQNGENVCYAKAYPLTLNLHISKLVLI